MNYSFTYPIIEYIIMPRENILVVDDEEDILELLRYNLMREGYRVSCTSSGEETLRHVRSEPPDLIVLDLMLPGMGGLEVTRQLKNDPATKEIPIVILTAKGEEADMVAGLELGAEDYITKPFSPRVLVARIRVVLRRQTKEAPDVSVLRIHNLTIHPGRHEVVVNGKHAQLTHTEFSILNCLARRPGWVFARSKIIDAVHGEEYAVTDRSIDVQIAGLRKKLGGAGEYIETVRGVGYRLKK